MISVKHIGNTYVKIEGQWYWSVGESLEAWYHDEEVLNSLVSGSGQVTEAERERLVVLMEECGEVIQAAAKILRHGWTSQYSDGTVNVDQLRTELDDVQGLIWAMETDGQIPGPYSLPGAVWERKRKWMYHQ